MNNIDYAIIVCPECRNRFHIELHQISKNGRNVRCSNCGNVWFTDQSELVMLDKDKKTKKQSYTNLIIKARKQQADGFFKNGKLSIPEENEDNHKQHNKNTATIIHLFAWPLALSSAVITIISATQNHEPLIPIQSHTNEIIYSSKQDKNQKFSMQNIQYTRKKENGKQLLIISGVVKNISDTENIPPKIDITFLQKNKKNDKVFKLSMRKEKLHPQESQKFISRLPTPSKNVKTISISLQNSSKTILKEQ